MRCEHWTIMLPNEYQAKLFLVSSSSDTALFLQIFVP